MRLVFCYLLTLTNKGVARPELSRESMDTEEMALVEKNWRRFPLLLTLRVTQARIAAKILILAGRGRRGRPFIHLVQRFSMTRALLTWLVGFRGTFASLAEAEAYVSRYVPTGHAHPREHVLQVAKADATRESDYPILFFLAPLAYELRSVFDFGGGIGNLFYVLDRHLRFSDELVWTIYDLPLKRQSAVAFAKLKNESRVTFTDQFSSASGVDLFVVVGALHFFEPTLADLIRPLDKPPKHVILNRTPFSHGEDIITVQDYGDWAFPCKLHSVAKLTSGMQSLGYELVASWPVHERKLNVALHPEYKEPYYGFYFRLCYETINTHDTQTGQTLRSF
jgi:putative methyltransferase (TIGR04325 family)